MEDPFLNFLSTLSDKIKVEKEHKDLMKNLEEPSKKEASLEDAINVLREKIIEQKKIIIPKQKEIQEVITELTPSNKKEEDKKEEKPIGITSDSEDLFGDFVGKLKDLLTKPGEVKQEPKVEVKPVEEKPVEVKKEEPVPVKDQPIEKPVPAKKIKQKEVKKETLKEIEPVDYVNLMDQLSTKITKEEEKGNVSDVKKLLEEYTEKYLKKLMVMQEYSGGGGSVAAQYAHGGTMDGDLNVTGSYLSAGVNLFSVLSGSGGGDPNVNTVVYSNSANWNSSYTTVQSYSASWSTGIQDLAFDENTALLSISYGNAVSLSALSGSKGSAGDPAVNTAVYTGSANWNSNYTTTNYFSAFWNAAVDEIFNFYVTQTDPGSAFVSEDGNYYVIANSKLDNNKLWDSAYTQIFLLSSSWSSVYVLVNANSAKWDSAYTTINTNSAKYDSVYSSTNRLSGRWESVYSTYNSLSASYAAETLAIAYAVAL